MRERLRVLLVVVLGAACAPEPGTVERVVTAPGGGATVVQLLHSPGGATISDWVSLCVVREQSIPGPGEEFACPSANRILVLNPLHGLTILWRGPTELELRVRQDARIGGFVRDCQGIHVSLERYVGFVGGQGRIPPNEDALREPPD